MGKEKKVKDAVKKPFYKKWWFWVIIIVVLAGVIGGGGGKDEGKGGTPPTTTEPEEGQTPEETKTDDVSADKFMEEVKTAIQEAISSITDAILELKDYDSLWETITVDFGEVGHITNNKTDIQTNGGGRYFPGENFKLQ